jgi:glycosyltransferase involved in cell wall biosynthesis
MLSIIIPTLNEEKYLPLLLEAIKKQDFADCEIIVADAGSEDKTTEIARNYGCKIVRGGSPAKGRNEGTKEARGDIFLFMDADNIFLPENFLKKLLREFGKRKLDVASFPIYPAGIWVDKVIYGLYNFWVNLIQSFSAYATNSILVKKEIHQKVGGFNEEITIAEDHSYAKRARKFGKFGFIKTEPVLTSTRRFEKDGRLKTYLKYFFAGIHLFFLGDIKSDIFHYRFNRHFKNKKNNV